MLALKKCMLLFEKYMLPLEKYISTSPVNILTVVKNIHGCLDAMAAPNHGARMMYRL